MAFDKCFSLASSDIIGQNYVYGTPHTRFWSRSRRGAKRRGVDEFEDILAMIVDFIPPK